MIAEFDDGEFPDDVLFEESDNARFLNGMRLLQAGKHVVEASRATVRRMDRAMIVRRARRNQRAAVAAAHARHLAALTERRAQEATASAQAISQIQEATKRGFGQLRAALVGVAVGGIGVSAALAYEQGRDRADRQVQRRAMLQVMQALDPEHARDYDRILDQQGK